MASAAVKRQRKRKRIDTDGDPEFQVAPMVDVLLVLMLFFMMITSTEVLKNKKNVHLADATHAKPIDNPKNQITINVEWDAFNKSAKYSLNQYSADTPEGLAGAIAEARADKPNGYVVIRADQDVEYSNISDLMTVCGNAGISSVAFAVMLNTNKPPAPETTAASQ